MTMINGIPAVDKAHATKGRNKVDGLMYYKMSNGEWTDAIGQARSAVRTPICDRPFWAWYADNGLVDENLRDGFFFIGEVED